MKLRILWNYFVLGDYGEDEYNCTQKAVSSLIKKFNRT